MNTQPVYRSAGNAKSLWQEYRLYDDRLELDTLFGLMSIPFEQIESVDLSESDIAGLFRGNLKLKNFRPALKLDWANFLEHVVVDKNEGKIRRILFTPDDPEVFIALLNEQLTQFRQREITSSS